MGTFMPIAAISYLAQIAVQLAKLTVLVLTPNPQEER